MKDRGSLTRVNIQNGDDGDPLIIQIMSETVAKEMDVEDVGLNSKLDQQSTSFMRNTMVSSTMVSGEASETDEEEDEEEKDQNEKGGKKKEEENCGTESGSIKELDQSESTEVQEVEQEGTKESKTKRQKIVYKFDSPFHRKLRERNLELRSDLVESLTQLYKSAGTRLDSSTFHLSRAQTAAQDVSHNTKMMLDDLSTISVLMENILETKLLNSLRNTTNNRN